jgi:hypothetical protein
MRDETIARGHADVADRVVYRARLSGRRQATTALAILIVIATATVAAGSSRYLPGSAAAAHRSPAESSPAVASAVASAQPSRSVQAASPAPSVKPASAAPSVGPAKALPSGLIAWTDETASPVASKPSVFPDLSLVQMEVGAIELPAYAVAGKPMTYVVVLSNMGDTPVSLDPCPGYKQSLFDMPDNEVGGGTVYLLNCAAIGPVIPPGQNVRLQMIYLVPAATPAGEQLFFWICDSDLFHAAIKAILEIRAR